MKGIISTVLLFFTSVLNPVCCDTNEGVVSNGSDQTILSHLMQIMDKISLDPIIEGVSRPQDSLAVNVDAKNLETLLLNSSQELLTSNNTRPHSSIKVTLFESPIIGNGEHAESTVHKNFVLRPIMGNSSGNATDINLDAQETQYDQERDSGDNQHYKFGKWAHKGTSKHHEDRGHDHIAGERNRENAAHAHKHHERGHDASKHAERKYRVRTEIEYFEREKVKRGHNEKLQASHDAHSETHATKVVQATAARDKASSGNNASGSYSSQQAIQATPLHGASSNTDHQQRNGYKESNYHHDSGARGKKDKQRSRNHFGWRERGYRIIAEKEYIDKAKKANSAFDVHSGERGHHIVSNDKHHRNRGHEDVLDFKEVSQKSVHDSGAKVRHQNDRRGGNREDYLYPSQSQNDNITVNSATDVDLLTTPMPSSAPKHVRVRVRVKGAPVPAQHLIKMTPSIVDIVFNSSTPQPTYDSLPFLSLSDKIVWPGTTTTTPLPFSLHSGIIPTVMHPTLSSSAPFVKIQASSKNTQSEKRVFPFPRPDGKFLETTYDYTSPPPISQHRHQFKGQPRPRPLTGVKAHPPFPIHFYVHSRRRIPRILEGRLNSGDLDHLSKHRSMPSRGRGSWEEIGEPTSINRPTKVLPPELKYQSSVQHFSPLLVKSPNHRFNTNNISLHNGSEPTKHVSDASIKITTKPFWKNAFFGWDNNFFDLSPDHLSVSTDVIPKQTFYATVFKKIPDVISNILFPGNFMSLFFPALRPAVTASSSFAMHKFQPYPWTPAGLAASASSPKIVRIKPRSIRRRMHSANIIKGKPKTKTIIRFKVADKEPITGMTRLIPYELTHSGLPTDKENSKKAAEFHSVILESQPQVNSAFTEKKENSMDTSCSSENNYCRINHKDRQIPDDYSYNSEERLISPSEKRFKKHHSEETSYEANQNSQEMHSPTINEYSGRSQEYPYLPDHLDKNTENIDHDNYSDMDVNDSEGFDKENQGFDSHKEGSHFGEESNESQEYGSVLPSSTFKDEKSVKKQYVRNPQRTLVKNEAYINKSHKKFHNSDPLTKPQFRHRDTDATDHFSVEIIRRPKKKDLQISKIARNWQFNDRNSRRRHEMLKFANKELAEARPVLEDMGYIFPSDITVHPAASSTVFYKSPVSHTSPQVALSIPTTIRPTTRRQYFKNVGAGLVGF